jgi:hypothetical protein
MPPVPVDSYLDLLIGPQWVNELTKALHIATLFSALGCFVAYLRPALVETGVLASPDPGHVPSPRVGRSMAWSAGVALAQSIWYVPAVYHYVFDGVQPASAPGLPDEARLLSLALMHTMLAGRWAERKPAKFGRRFAFASVGSAVLTAAVFLLLPPPVS